MGEKILTGFRVLATPHDVVEKVVMNVDEDPKGEEIHCAPENILVVGYKGCGEFRRDPKADIAHDDAKGRENGKPQ